MIRHPAFREVFAPMAGLIVGFGFGTTSRITLLSSLRLLIQEVRTGTPDSFGNLGISVGTSIGLISPRIVVNYPYERNRF
jgi:hypothetical protein